MSEQFAERTIHLPGEGVDLAVRHYPGDGPTLLAVHGWLDNLASFHRLAPLLPGYEIIAIDLPGHGRSSPLPGRNYMHAAYNACLAELIRVLDRPDLWLMGHSMGGGICTMVAGTLPAGIRGLILLDSLGPLETRDERFPELMGNYLQALADQKQTEPRIYGSVEEAVASRMRSFRHQVSAEGSRLIVERALSPVDGGWSWHTDERIILPQQMLMTPDQVRSVMQAIAVPVLMVKATRRNSRRPYPFERRLGWIGRLQMAEVAGNHHAHLDVPDMVSDPVLEFLNKHRQG